MLSEDAAVHFDPGNALLAQGKPNEAEANFRQVLALDPGCAEFYNNLATTLLDQHLDEAIDSYRQAIGLAPGNAGAHLNIANAPRGREEWVEAEVSYRRALDLDPINAGGREVLRGIWLSLCSGAKIGGLGLNGAGKPPLLPAMSAEEHQFAVAQDARRGDLRHNNPAGRAEQGAR